MIMLTTSVLLLLTSVVHISVQQSTTSVPPGYCANYLNRYTKENQCIYSFIVPKQDKDDCPSMKTDVQELKDLVAELQKRQQLADEDRHELKTKITDQKLLGKLEGDVQICNNDRTLLQRENEQLKTEKSRIEHNLNDNQVDLVDIQRELADLKVKYEPTMANYSRLITQYNNLVVNMKNLQESLNKTTTAYNILKAERDCSEFNKHLPSCAVIKQWGYTKSGYAMIDPDGEGGGDPFKVFCDMESDESTGITIIDHQYQKETVVAGCNTPGCKSMIVNYTGVSVEQLVALTNISLSCSQYIRYGCYDSKLLKEDTAWWVDSRGRKQTYWGGAPAGSDKCQCGMKQTCYDPNEVCHCDADTEAWLYDEGFLTDKDSLPVQELRFGDIETDAGERGNFTLGSLRCKWSTTSVVPSCASLQSSGVTKSGLYLVNTDESGNTVEPFQVRCDFSTSDTGSTTIVQNMNIFAFTSCNQVGRFGPTKQLCDESYKTTNIKIVMRNGTQSWRTPRAGVYRITASAPSGYTPNGLNPGRGATVTAAFEIPGDNEMLILIGQRGVKHSGAGGTFVIKMYKQWTKQLLIVAGAGGSSNAAIPNLAVTDASRSKTGKDGSRTGSNFGKGGSEGQGGEMGGSNSGPNTSGGGAGYHGNGAASSDQRFTPKPESALKYLTHAGRASGLGGSYTYNMNNIQTKYTGGFGGGGSGAKEAPGGAGGYSGGGGGPNQGFSGGGGTYVNPELAKDPQIEINNNGKGKVVIEYLGPISAETTEEER